MITQPAVTQLLQKAQTGDKASLDELLPIVYGELRKLAAYQLKRERPDHTLQLTALVHEAYLRLVNQREVDWRNRAQFFGLAAQMMRRILVNHAEEKKAQKRGGKEPHISLDEAISFTAERNLDLVILDDTLNRLAELDAQQARIVELRFFGGLTVEEVAEVLSVSERTVKRDWRTAKVWLYQQMK